MNTDTLTINFLELPELYVFSDHELELAIESCKRRYGEAACQTRAALDMYDDAIDRELPYASVNELWKVYEIMQAQQSRACDLLDRAKAQLLEREARRS